jgi:hypothetical protein
MFPVKTISKTVNIIPDLHETALGPLISLLKGFPGDGKFTA